MLGVSPVALGPRQGARTRFEDEEVQGVVAQVGGCGDLVRGDAQDQLLVVAPGEQEAAGGQAEDAVLLRRRLQGQLLQLLWGRERVRGRGGGTGGTGGTSPWGAGCPLTLAVSSSCSTSSRLEGFRDAVTQVRCPKNWGGAKPQRVLGRAGGSPVGGRPALGGTGVGVLCPPTATAPCTSLGWGGGEPAPTPTCSLLLLGGLSRTGGGQNPVGGGLPHGKWGC